MTRGGPAPLSVKGVCLDAAGRVLVCRNWRREWELPGGRPELGEELPACLAREVEEETGLQVDVRYRDAARLWQERRAMSHN